MSDGWQWDEDGLCSISQGHQNILMDARNAFRMKWCECFSEVVQHTHEAMKEQPEYIPGSSTVYKQKPSEYEKERGRGKKSIWHEEIVREGREMQLQANLLTA